MVTLGSSLAPLGTAHADVPAEEQQFVDLINQTRAGLGLPPLQVYPELTTVARDWSEKMRSAAVAAGSKCLISHNPNLRNAVSASWKKLGENVGCGDVGVGGLHHAFVNSPRHYDNIVDPQYDTIGIGIVYEGTLMFVTEQFMDLNDAPAPSTPAALAAAPPSQPASKVLSASAVPATTAKSVTTVKKTTKKVVRTVRRIRRKVTTKRASTASTASKANA